MLSSLRLVSSASAILLIAAVAGAQIQPDSSGEINLSAGQTYAVLAPANTPVTLIPFQIDADGREDEGFDVVADNPGAVVTLILPNGTEITSTNAASYGYSYDVLAADSTLVTSDLFISMFSVAGTHTFIRMADSAPSGTYQVKVSTMGILSETSINASFLSRSPIRVALSSDSSSYSVGDRIILSAFVFNGTTPVTTAAISAAVVDQLHPETTPTQLTLLDSGPDDAATGDGIYTGVFTGTTAGKFIAAIRATGATPSGAAYTRTAATTFRVLPPLASLNAFSDEGQDDNGNGLFDRLVLTANATAQQAGNYRLEVSLLADNDREISAAASATLIQGGQQVSVSFTAKQVLGLRSKGPYTIKSATLVYLDDPEEPTAVFIANAGVTASYLLPSFEHEALEFTGNNIVEGVDTNGNGKFDILRIQAEVIVTHADTYDWSGSLRDSTGKEIQAIDARGALSANLNLITFEFSGSKIGQHGKDGPFALRSVLLFSDTVSAALEELLRTQAFPVTAFECSDAVAPPVQTLTLNSATVVGGNAATLHVVLSQPAPVCGAKVVINSDNPAVIAATMPTNVIIPAGQNATDVTVITTAVATPTTVALTATAGGTSQSASLTINPSKLNNLTLGMSGVGAGGLVTGTVTLDGLAPTGDLTVALASSATNVATVPASVVVRAGYRTANFAVITNSAFQGHTSVTISATTSPITKTALLEVFSEVTINGEITAGGSPVTVTSTEPGQNFLLAFAGTAGQRVSLRLTDVSMGTSFCCGVQVSIRKPDGSTLTGPVWAGTSGGFVDAQTLEVSGTYYVFVDPLIANIGSLTLTLYNVPPDVSPTITPGGPALTLTTSVPGQNIRPTFAGVAGQRVSLRLSNVTIGAASLNIYNPDGTLLSGHPFFNTGGLFVSAVTLPTAGTYAIFIDPTVDHTGSLDLTLYDVPPDVSGSITPGGPPVTVNTTVPGQAAALTFAGTQGQRVSLKIAGVALTGGNSYVDVYLNKPNGTTLAAVTFISAAGFIDVQTLPTTGTYTVLAVPQGSNIGSFTLTLYNVPPDFTASTSAGAPPLVVTTSVPGQNAQVTFNGSVGQRVTLNISSVMMTGSNGYVDVYLNKPDGSSLASAIFVGAGGAFINTQALPVAGVYTILVNPQAANTGSITLTLNDVSADVTGTVVPGGSSVTVTTNSPGQNAQLTFDGTEGQRISLKITGVTVTGGNGYVDVHIKKPDGSTLGSAVFLTSSGFVDVLTLPVTGIYTVLVDPQGNNVGSVTLTLYTVPADVVGAITPGGPAVTATATTPGQNARLTFDGVAGQRVSLKITGVSLTGGNGYAYIIIKKPDGNTLAQEFVNVSGYIDVQVLPVSGTYTILFDPVGAGVGSATLMLYSVPADISAWITPNGEALTITTTTPGQNAVLTFSGTQAQRVSLKITGVTLTGGNGYAYFIIKKPDGTTLAQDFTNWNGFIDLQTLPTTGTYSVVVDPTGANTGSATLTLYDVPADVTGPITPGGAAVTVTTTTCGQNARLTFAGTAGQRVSLNITGVSLTGGNGYTYVYLKKPDDSALANGFTNWTGFIDVQTLPTSGTYSVLVDPTGTNTGTATITLYDVPADATGAVSIGGSAAPLAVTVPGQNARVTFSGAVGQQVTVRIANNTMGFVTVRLLKPDGTQQTLTSSSGSNFNLPTQTLPVAGTYAITIDPNANNLGSMNVNVTSP